PIILKLGRINIYSYGLMLALGFIITGIIFRKELKRVGINVDLADSVIIAALLGGIFGAKVYSVIEGIREYGLSSLKDFFSGAGLVWYGGLIGGTIAVLVTIKLKHYPILPIIDLIAPLLILGYGIGRMGCFLSGDGDYGPPSDLPWAMAFPNGTVPTTERVHPTPLYELIMSLIAFAYLWKIRKKTRGPGYMFGMFLILSGIERFIAEFWRITAKVLFDVISVAQIIGVLTIIIGIYLILRSKKLPPYIVPQVIDEPDTKQKNKTLNKKGKSGKKH
ncbi:TPA: prolipoprotein diacylglyceryl transferase, partial [Candidatus Poribacteria bacterium]|nr:prolipoprotein diacylglyceryl transferase [Candidatus Poribacteria bacterium]